MENFQYQLAGTRVGLEQERFIANPNVTNKVAIAQLRNLVPEDSVDGFQTEIDAGMIEYTSAPVTVMTIQDSLDEIALREFLLLQVSGILPNSMPFDLPDGYTIRSPQIDNPQKQRYYSQLIEAYGHNMLVTGRHLHFQLPDEVIDHLYPNEPDLEEVSIDLCRHARPLVAEMIALSASSPFQNKEITPFKSVRNLVFPKPATIDRGLLYQNPQNYHRLVDKMRQKGDIFYWPNHLYTPVRPKPGGRIELRSLDTVSNPNLEYAHVLYFHLGLIDRVLEMRDNPHLEYEYSDCAVETMRKNEEAVAKCGANGVIDTHPFSEGGKKRVIDVVRDRFPRVQRLAEDFGLAEKLAPMEEFLHSGITEADKIRARYNRAGSFDEFAHHEVQRFRDQVMGRGQDALQRINKNSPDVVRNLGRAVAHVSYDI